MTRRTVGNKHGQKEITCKYCGKKAWVSAMKKVNVCYDYECALRREKEIKEINHAAIKKWKKGRKNALPAL